jgi:hypothetical protein
MLSDDSITGSPVLDKKSDDRILPHDSDVATSSYGEPIVTRRELWSYYCKRRFDFLSSLRGSNRPSSVYFNGDAVRPLKFSFIQGRVLNNTRSRVFQYVSSSVY